jgi:hypothetical protein
MELKKILTRTIFKGNRVSLVPHKGSIAEYFQYFSEQEIYYMFGIKPPYNDAIIRKKDREPWSAISKIISNKTNTLCGFIHFVIHDDIKREISIHGSGINKSIGHVRNYVDGWNLAIDVCRIKLNCRDVTSYCFKENKKAISFFNKSNYLFRNTTDDVLYFSIDKTT